MKTTKQKLLNTIITMSVTINVVLLGGLGFIASIDNNIERVYTSMNQPIVVYVPKSVEAVDATTPIAPPSQ